MSTFPGHLFTRVSWRDLTPNHELNGVEVTLGSGWTMRFASHSAAWDVTKNGAIDRDAMRALVAIVGGRKLDMAFFEDVSAFLCARDAEVTP